MIEKIKAIFTWLKNFWIKYKTWIKIVIAIIALGILILLVKNIIIAIIVFIGSFLSGGSAIKDELYKLNEIKEKEKELNEKVNNSRDRVHNSVKRFKKH